VSGTVEKYKKNDYVEHQLKAAIAMRVLIEKARERLTLNMLIGAIVAFGVGALSMQTLLIRGFGFSKPESKSLMLTEGFDFGYFRSSGMEWRGPDVGTKIDLTRFRMKDGTTLASLMSSEPIVLVSVDRRCAMCRASRDEMNLLREKLTSMGIKYYPVCFGDEASPSDFFDYSDSLKLGAPGLLWKYDGGPPPDALLRMVTPSHLLLNNDGTVIRVWPGSYKEKAIRDRMTHQILADTSVARDTLTALVPKKISP
jgi:hypothetical protein